MAMKSSPYQIANKGIRDYKFAITRLMLLFRRIQTRIEVITIFLGQVDILDKVLKDKISLLSSLLDVKRKVKTELKELASDTRKGEDSLSEILSSNAPPK